MKNNQKQETYVTPVCEAQAMETEQVLQTSIMDWGEDPNPLIF